MGAYLSKHMNNQHGFTLIELMISLVLGLLISAAVIQVFITSQRVDRIQTAGSEIQDKAMFGLQMIESQVRLANLGNDGVSINDTTAMGGIVLTASETNSANIAINDVSDGFVLTRTLKNDDLTNINGVPSDQLSIQYVNTTNRILYDCESQKILPDEHVVMRYFINESNIKTDKTRKNLNLNCDAGRIKSNGSESEAIGFGNNGETIIENVDQFNIRLGVQRALVVDGALTYQHADMTIAEYMALGGQKPAITNIKIAILARSTANSPESSAESFNIFGTPQTLKAQDNAPKYLRRVYESNVLLRNARVMRIVDSGAE